MTHHVLNELENRIVIHMDLDYFFAQCEEREDPGLKDKPVVVCVFSGRTPDSGAVSTSNYVARKMGVRSGVPIAQAKRILKDTDAVFLPVNHTLYSTISDDVMEIAQTYADIFERRGVDECYLDVTHKTEGSYGKAEELAHHLKRELLEKERLTCSLGIAPNKLVAKVASDYQKPDGLTIVKPSEVEDFLATLPVGRLYGVGVKTEAALSSIGIRSVGELAQADLEILTEAFGKNLAQYLHNSAKGVDNETVTPREPSKQISRIITLKEDTRDLNIILPEIERVSELAHKTLHERQTSFRTVSVLAVMENLTLRTKSRTIDKPSTNSETIVENSRALLEALLAEDQGLRIRRVGVKLSGLGNEPIQPRLTSFFQEGLK